MKEIYDSLFSSKTTVFLLVFLGFILGVATFIEDRFDTYTARLLVYNSKWFEFTLLLLALNFIGHIKRFNMFRWSKAGGLLFHLSFVVMIIGAGVTRYFGFEGDMHIREGSSSSVIYNVGANLDSLELPFSIQLNDFILERYPGSESPSSYASEVTLSDPRNGLKENHRIFMNHVLDYDNYRFFQSSYDRDEKGTILSVNHDFWGTWISYFAYAMLTLGCIITMLTRGSRFLSLRKYIAEVRTARKTLLLIPALLFSMNAFCAKGDPNPPVSSIQSENFGKIISQSREGRFEPVHTLAYDILHKVSRKDQFSFEGKGKMDAMQVFLDMMVDPEFWEKQEIIYVREKSVRDVIGITGSHAAFLDFFDGGNQYKLKSFVENAFRKKQSEQNVFDKEIIKVDERVNIYLMAVRGTILKIFPDKDSPDNKWVSWNERPAFVPLDGVVNFMKNELNLETLNYTGIMTAYLKEIKSGTNSGDYSKADKILKFISGIQMQGSNRSLLPDESRVKAEIFYNKAQIFVVLKNCYAVLSILLLVLTFIQNVKNRGNRLVDYSVNFLTFLLAVSFLYHTVGMALRWYITGHAPWSNGYEALVLVAWGSLLAGLCFVRYSKITLAATALLAFFTMMTASHSNYDPQLTNLAPVLKSYWLIIHVAVLTVSYGFLGLGFILGIFNLFIFLLKNETNRKRLDLLITELTFINEMNLTIGIVLATIGTFLGGVWANESWGRYWGWDAKETWALIITITYTVVLHLRLVPKLKGDYIFNVASVLGFGSVLMTFFGVNYYLSKGMHSYASGDTPVFPVWAWITILSVIALIIAAGLREKAQAGSRSAA